MLTKSNNKNDISILPKVLGDGQLLLVSFNI